MLLSTMDPVAVHALSLVRLNLASAGAYKHLAAQTPSIFAERLFVQTAAERWRQWAELRTTFSTEDIAVQDATLAENELREFSTILAQGEWTPAAVIEADLFLRDVYDEAIAALHDDERCSMLKRHRGRINEQIHRMESLIEADAEIAMR